MVQRKVIATWRTLRTGRAEDAQALGEKTSDGVGTAVPFPSRLEFGLV